jgi:putative transposase
LFPCARRSQKKRYAERFARSIKEECLERIIIVGQGSLRCAVREYVVHYHVEPNHQGFDDRLLKPVDQAHGQNGIITKRERLGGILSYYCLNVLD